MSAEDFAVLTDAKRTGPGRWMGRCPSHPDKTPSLSIRESGDRVLLHCFSGCAPQAILKALGLSWADVNGKPLSLEQRWQAATQRAQREATEQARRRARREADQNASRWQAIVDALGGKLARQPENAELARLFHQACDRLHEADVIAEEIA